MKSPSTVIQHVLSRLHDLGVKDIFGVAGDESFEGARALPALAFLATGALLFPSSGRDDVYITYGPALALAETGSISNWNGEAVEQSSSLLDVVLPPVPVHSLAKEEELLLELHQLLVLLLKIPWKILMLPCREQPSPHHGLASPPRLFILSGSM